MEHNKLILLSPDFLLQLKIFKSFLLPDLTFVVNKNRWHQQKQKNVFY